MKPTTKVHSLLIFHVFISGFNYLAVKIVMQSGIDPLAVIFLRISCAALFFSALVAFQKKQPKLRWKKSDVITLVLCALFGTVLNQVFFYYGMKITNPINASIFNLLNPITIILLSYFLVKEKTTKITLFGFFTALAGCFLLLDFQQFNVSGSTFWGDIFILINAISFGAYIVLVGTLSRKFHPFLVSSAMLIVGFIIVTPFSIMPLLQTNWSVIGIETWLAIAFIVVFNTIIAYAITNYLPTITSPYIMGVYVYAQPFVTAIMAVALGKDELTFQKIICGLVIILGISLAQYGRKREPIPETAI
ncbi:MAG: DMT family transporter [Cytophagales bacterium]